MTEPANPLPEKSPETNPPTVAEALPSGQAWPREQILPGGIQPPLPGLQTLMGIQTQVWQAGYPPPDAAERFEKLQPGAFNRMLAMAEKAQDAAIATAKQANDYHHSDMRRAHSLGVMLAGAAIVAALIVALVTRSAVITGLFLSVPFFSVITALFNSAKPKERQAPVKPQPPSRSAN